MILSAQSIRRLKIVEPFVERDSAHGFSYGLSACGYDIRIAEDLILNPGDFALASTVESFAMPNHIAGIVHDKSTWARLGLALQNTIIEPGWHGHSLTLELSNHGRDRLTIVAGMPIAQVVFHLLDEPTEQPYAGKYQNQKRGAQEAILDARIDEAGSS